MALSKDPKWSKSGRQVRTGAGGDSQTNGVTKRGPVMSSVPL